MSPWEDDVVRNGVWGLPIFASLRAMSSAPQHALGSTLRRGVHPLAPHMTSAEVIARGPLGNAVDFAEPVRMLHSKAASHLVGPFVKQG